MVNVDEIRSALAEHFPQWTGWIDRLEIKDAVGVRPVDNDGQIVYYNSRLMSYYTDETQRFYIAQQLLHLQFMHHARGQGRDRATWKRASDAVVNRMLRYEGFQVPMEAILMADQNEMSAEALYDIMIHQDPPQTGPDPLMQERRPMPDKKHKPGKSTEGATREIEDPGLAAAVAGLSELLEPSLQLDYDWFPGTTVRDGMLPWQFRPYPVAHAEILLDTSASVDTDLVRAFVKGVKALLQEDAVIRVGCFDTRFYGFREIHTQEDIDSLELRGAGGTDFSVAVAAFTGDAENKIIFTDGYAEMPSQRCDCLWVVYGSTPIHPNGGRVIYSRPPEEKEKHEIDFLIT